MTVQRVLFPHVGKGTAHLLFYENAARLFFYYADDIGAAA